MFQTRRELGYGIDGWASFEPFVSLTYVNFTNGSFNERGGAATLRVDSKAIDTTFNTLGLRVHGGLDFGGQKLGVERPGGGGATPMAT